MSISPVSDLVSVCPDAPDVMGRKHGKGEFKHLFWK
jgi:hypothetical protein